MMETPLKVLRARRHGIRRPLMTFQEARRAGITYWAACAFLMQETGGGRNVFGHDPTIYVGAGRVTKKKYLAYRKMRDKTGKFQGVGPMQLTFGLFQDNADKMGGCWKPRFNMREAFRIIAFHRKREGSYHAAALRYNGSESYADQMDGRFKEWKAKLKEK